MTDDPVGSVKTSKQLTLPGVDRIMVRGLTSAASAACMMMSLLAEDSTF